MESIFYRYRNIIVLLLVLCAQIMLLAWQVKNDTDVPMVRVWAVTAVTPVASTIETLRNGTTGFFSNYFELRNAREQSRKLRTEVDRLRLENQFIRNELASAQRAEALAGFQAKSLSKMIGARVIGATPGMGTKSVLIDRGSSAGIRRDMAVVTPDGIVGKVVSVFPFASQVLSVSDPGFGAGVESQKNHVHGVLKGLGNGTAKVDYVPTGQKIEVGEMLFTSGEDRIFPKGLPVGKVTSVREGGNFQDITVEPSGTESAPEEVLVILDPVHQEIPDEPPPETPVFLAPDVNPDDKAPSSGSAVTTADKLREQYQRIGDAQKHVFGEGGPGTPPPNFNLKVPGVNAPASPVGATGTQAAIPKAAGATGITGPVKPAPAGATGTQTVAPKTVGASGVTGAVKPVAAAATGPQTSVPRTTGASSATGSANGSGSANGLVRSAPATPQTPPAVRKPEVSGTDAPAAAPASPQPQP
jgi:rod shape-determining protein MreC